MSQEEKPEISKTPSVTEAETLPSVTEMPEEIFVDVCGAVAYPGVYALEAGSRVFQAIEASEEAKPDQERINLNTADLAALQTLSGIGEAKAQAILAYREEHGGFSSVEDLMNVPGIKEGTFLKIKDKLAVE